MGHRCPQQQPLAVGVVVGAVATTTAFDTSEHPSDEQEGPYHGRVERVSIAGSSSSSSKHLQTRPGWSKTRKPEHYSAAIDYGNRHRYRAARTEQQQQRFAADYTKPPGQQQQQNSPSSSWWMSSLSDLLLIGTLLPRAVQWTGSKKQHNSATVPAATISDSSERRAPSVVVSACRAQHEPDDRWSVQHKSLSPATAAATAFRCAVVVGNAPPPTETIEKYSPPRDIRAKEKR
uniref:Uncharacterized protein n=1 Tax=Anopheles melas TaxID=34690 RepID=A0A182TIU5_9DIPT